MSIKSITSYQAEIKYIPRRNLTSTFKGVFFIVGNKIFCFFKNMNLCFFGRGYISRGWGGWAKRGEINISGWG